jgi:hypothetical protein
MYVSSMCLFIILQLPTEDEIAMIKAAEDPENPAGFDKPERILLALHGIPFLAERLKCWSFKLEFAEHKSNVTQPIETLTTGIQVILRSFYF